MRYAKNPTKRARFTMSDFHICSRLLVDGIVKRIRTGDTYESMKMTTDSFVFVIPYFEGEIFDHSCRNVAADIAYHIDELGRSILFGGSTVNAIIDLVVKLNERFVIYNEEYSPAAIAARIEAEAILKREDEEAMKAKEAKKEADFFEKLKRASPQERINLIERKLNSFCFRAFPDAGATKHFYAKLREHGM